MLFLQLDLSAAFDTVDHDLLLRMLESHYGIIGRAHEWIKSFLADRTQRVKVREAKSETEDVPYGVVQGSVLGPLLFILYISPVSQVFQKHGYLIVDMLMILQLTSHTTQRSLMKASQKCRTV